MPTNLSQLKVHKTIQNPTGTIKRVRFAKGKNPTKKENKIITIELLESDLLEIRDEITELMQKVKNKDLEILSIKNQIQKHIYSITKLQELVDYTPEKKNQ